MAELIANVLTASDGTVTTLSSALSTTDGTSIATAGAFPAALRSGTCRIRIDNELMIATVNGSGVVTLVERGVEGSTAATHASGARVRHVLTAGSLSAQSGSGVPAGGSTGEVLAKASDADGDADWVQLGSASLVVTTVDDTDPSFSDYPSGTQWIKGAF